MFTGWTGLREKNTDLGQDKTKQVVQVSGDWIKN